MHVPSARGVAASLALATTALWLTAVTAQAQEPLPGVSIPKAPTAAAASVAKSAVPTLTNSKPVQAARPALAQAKATVSTTVSTVSSSVTQAVESAQPPAKPVVQSAVHVVKQATAPVQHIVESVAPAPVTQTIGKAATTVEAATGSLEPAIAKVERPIERLEPASSSPPPAGVVVTAPPKSDPNLENVEEAAPLESTVTAARAPRIAVVTEQVTPATVVTVVEEQPVVTLEPIEPTSVVPVEAVLDIHDALPTTKEFAAVSPTPTHRDEAPLPTFDPMETASPPTETALPSTVVAAGDEALALTGFSVEPSQRDEPTPVPPWLPLSPEDGAAPVSMPATALSGSGAPSAAAAPVGGLLTLTVSWQARPQLAHLPPPSFAISSLAPPG